MERQMLAYFLIAFILAAAAAGIAYARHNTHERKVRRQNRRDQAAWRKRDEEKERVSASRHP